MNFVSTFLGITKNYNSNATISRRVTNIEIFIFLLDSTLINCYNNDNLCDLNNSNVK